MQPLEWLELCMSGYQIVVKFNMSRDAAGRMLEYEMRVQPTVSTT